MLDYNRSQCANSELVSDELVNVYCLPVLLYTLESTASRICTLPNIVIVNSKWPQRYRR